MADNVEYEGQIIHFEWTFTWVKLGSVPAGHPIAPVRIPESKDSDEFAALHLIVKDFELAHFCFKEALKHGLPDDSNQLVKALISAGVLAYAKPFDYGLRRFKLSPMDFDKDWSDARKSIHAYLYDLRQKHILLTL